MSRKSAIGQWPRSQDGSRSGLKANRLSLRHIAWLVGQIVWPDARELRRPGLLAAVLVILITSRSFVVLVPALQAAIVSQLDRHLNGGLSAPQVLWLSLPLLLVIAFGITRSLQNTLEGLADLLVDLLSLPAIRRITLRAFGHVLNLPLAYHLDAKAGTLSQGLKRGLAAAENLANRLLLTLGPVVFELGAATLVVWLWFGWYEAAIIVVIALGYLGITRLFDPVRNAALKTVNAAEDRVNGTLIESLTHIESVKVFGAAPRQLEETNAGLRDYQEASIKVSIHWLLRIMAVWSLLGLGLILILSGVTQEIMAGQRALGDFVFLSGITMGLFRPIAILAMIGRRIQDDMIHTERLFALLDEPNPLADEPGAPDLKLGAAALAIEGVSLSYQPGRPILQDLSLELPAGSLTGIVGATGAGKSSLIKLLFRLYRPDQGRITIDGQDIWQVSGQSLTRHLVLVPQDTVLLNDSIEANLRFAKPDATPEQMQEALWVACIDDFVARQPEGLATLIGERGLKLSGGERQRMAIARAVLKRPRIYVFDEATSSLDSKTEALVQERLAAVTQGATRLVIAHRLSTIQAADRIAVLEQGRLVELGRHTELLAKAGLYAALWQRQSEAQGGS